MSAPDRSAPTSAPPVPAELAARVRLVVFDVDGVLTDGGVYVGRTRSPDGWDGDPVELKRFNIQDGLGLKMLQRAGLEVMIVSGRQSPATSLRAAELEMSHHQDDDARKLPVVLAAMERLGIGWDAVAMLADDLPDVAVLRQAGLKAAVANAVPLVADMADWRSTLAGGHGAAREFCDALLAARGQLEDVVEAYVAERSEP